MNLTDYRGVASLLALDNPVLRQELLDAFAAAGFPAPSVAAGPESLRQLLSEQGLDLIVMTSTYDGIFVAAMISEMRRGRLGPHPFPIVVLLVTEPDPTALRQASNCGPDDVIALPCAPQDLLDRINWFLSGNRRPLVVNDGYAGPERRNRGR